MICEKPIIDFYNGSFDVNNQRFLSWVHCYKYFKSDKIDIDLACLHLGFYLASWGMYRGSSFLLNRDYKIHRKCVEKILKIKYKKLRHINLDDYKNGNNSKNIELLFCLVKEILGDKETKGCYEQKPSDTLVTKILLGTLGCVPAYDDFFKRQLKKEEPLVLKNNRIPAAFSERSFEKFIDECEARKEIFKDFKKNVKIAKNYPDMKIIDMYFWGKAYIESDMYKKNKEKYLI